MSRNYHDAEREYQELNPPDDEENQAWHRSFKEDCPAQDKEEHYNEMLKLNAEIQVGREEAAEEYGGMDEGHQTRIDKYVDEEQLTHNAIAHEKGEYEYAKPMREYDDGEEEEEGAEDDGEKNEQEEFSDMDIEDSDKE